MVEDRGGSARLINSLTAAYESGSVPYETVGDYIRSHMDRDERLLGLPNFGKNSAKELREIVEETIKDTMPLLIDICSSYAFERLLIFVVIRFFCNIKYHECIGLIE